MTIAASPAHGVPVVHLVGVRKSYNPGQPNETEVLHGVDLRLERGELCAVMGPSGSGKSTLLNIVGLLDRPSGGSVLIEGDPTQHMSDRELTRLRGRSIGFVFQYHHLIAAFSARENVMLPMIAAATFADDEMAARADMLLDRVGLLAWRDQPVMQLSGGQQQRVAVARALAMNPPLLLADEPTGNLDTRSADAVFDLLREVNQHNGTAILFVTHNAALAARCDRTIQVVDGRIAGQPAAVSDAVATASPDAVLDAAQTRAPLPHL